MSVLSEANQKQIEDILVRDKQISASDLAKVKEMAEKESRPFFELLVSERHVSNEYLTKVIAQINRVPYVNLQDARIDKQVLRLLSKEVSQRYMAVPLGQIQNKLVVAMLDADNVQAVDFLSSRIGRPLKVYTASEEGIIKVIKQYDEDIEADVTSTVGSISSAATEEAQQIKEAANAPTNSNIKTIIQDSPISKALSAILEYAARTRASDIHIEPLEHELKIRCRVDGVLREIMKLPKSTEPPLISRIKILSNLKIDEHRIPQDGQFTVSVEGNAIDLSIAISPVVWGEQVVIRLLDKSGTSLKLEDMGYTGRALRTIKKGVAQSNGMILTSGPTGSGKSTSMYALI